MISCQRMNRGRIGRTVHQARHTVDALPKVPRELQTLIDSGSAI